MDWNELRERARTRFLMPNVDDYPRPDEVGAPANAADREIWQSRLEQQVRHIAFTRVGLAYVVSCLAIPGLVWLGGYDYILSQNDPSNNTLDSGIPLFLAIFVAGAGFRAANRWIVPAIRLRERRVIHHIELRSQAYRDEAGRPKNWPRRRRRNIFTGEF